MRGPETESERVGQLTVRRSTTPEPVPRPTEIGDGTLYLEFAKQREDLRSGLVIEAFPEGREMRAQFGTIVTSMVEASKSVRTKAMMSPEDQALTDGFARALERRYEYRSASKMVHERLA